MTGAAQILAEELGVDLTDINATDVDTHVSPYDYGAQGSRTAFSVGNACIAAAKDLGARCGSRMAALSWECRAESILLEGKGVVSGNNACRWPRWRGSRRRTGGGLISHGTYDPADADLRSQAGQEPSAAQPGPAPASMPMRSSCRSTPAPARSRSSATWWRRTSASRSIRPTSRARSRAASRRASARRCREEIVYDGGRVLNANLTDYKMPTMMDVPRVECDPDREAQRQRPLRGQGRRRAALHPAAGRDRQCHRRRHGRPHPRRCRSRRSESSWRLNFF